MELHLSARPPFSLSAVIQSHGWARLVPFQHESESGTLGYTYRLDTGRVVQLAIHEQMEGVSVEFQDQIDRDEETEIAQDMTWMLGLDRDLSSFYAVASQEPKLAHVVDKVEGRILRSSSFFEDTVKTILTTNTAWSGTKRMALALERHGLLVLAL